MKRLLERALAIIYDPDPLRDDPMNKLDAFRDLILSIRNLMPPQTDEKAIVR